MSHVAAKLLPRVFFSGLLSLLGLAAPAAAEPPMWVAKDADSTVYLLGTIHVLKPGVQWRSAKLDRALAESQDYWMEADVGEDPAIAQTYILNFGFDRQHPLSQKLAKGDYAKFVAVAQSLHLSVEKLDPMRPWFATMALTQAQVASLGYKPSEGADVTLQKAAVAAGKPVKTFETVQQQLGFLSGLPDKFAAEMLVQTVRGLDKGARQIDAMEAAWLAGDVGKVEQVGFADMKRQAPGLYDVIVVQRNVAWVKRIDALMQGSGVSFIAVGAAHLIGPDGLPARLKALGYKVERY